MTNELKIIYTIGRTTTDHGAAKQARRACRAVRIGALRAYVCLNSAALIEAAENAAERSRQSNARVRKADLESWLIAAAEMEAEEVIRDILCKTGKFLRFAETRGDAFAEVFDTLIRAVAKAAMTRKVVDLDAFKRAQNAK